MGRAPYHKKPIVIVNTDGYWNPLLELLEQMRISLVLFVVSMPAAPIPASRAASIQPADALRAE